MHADAFFQRYYNLEPVISGLGLPFSSEALKALASNHGRRLNRFCTSRHGHGHQPNVALSTSPLMHVPRLSFNITSAQISLCTPSLYICHHRHMIMYCKPQDESVNCLSSLQVSCISFSTGRATVQICNAPTQLGLGLQFYHFAIGHHFLAFEILVVRRINWADC